MLIYWIFQALSKDRTNKGFGLTEKGFCVIVPADYIFIVFGTKNTWMEKKFNLSGGYSYMSGPSGRGL